LDAGRLVGEVMKVGDLVITSQFYRDKYKHLPRDPGAGVIVKLGNWIQAEQCYSSYTVSWSNWNGRPKEKIMSPKWLELLSEGG
jgi:hypothetical protein